eukprot:1544008-Pyramimonas_sp.AAC.1
MPPSLSNPCTSSSSGGEGGRRGRGERRGKPVIADPEIQRGAHRVMHSGKKRGAAYSGGRGSG